MTANVSADELDFVQIDRKLIERAVEALERAKCAGRYLACARRAGTCVGVKREFGDIGRSRIRYKAASDALGLITRLAEAQR